MILIELVWLIHLFLAFLSSSSSLLLLNHCSIRFLLFASIWTLLFSLAYVGIFLAATSSIAASLGSHFVFTVVTFFFWLGGAAAMTDNTSGGLQCGNWHDAHCNQLNAVLAFAWIECMSSSLHSSPALLTAHRHNSHSLCPLRHLDHLLARPIHAQRQRLDGQHGCISVSFFGHASRCLSFPHF